MADEGLEVPISFPLQKAGAVDANKLLEEMRQQIKGVTDETKAYTDWLAKNAKELGAESKAQAAATDELKRYEATLEKMRVAQVEATKEESKRIAEMAEAKKKTEQLAEATKKTAIESVAAGEMTREQAKQTSRELDGVKEGVKKLAMQFGALGQVALAALKSGPALLLVALAVGINALVTATTDWINKLRAAGEEADKLKLTKFTALQQAISGAAESLTRFNLEMKHVGEPPDPITAEFEAKKAEFEARRRAAGTPITTAEQQAMMEEEKKRREAAAPGLEQDARAKQAAATAPNQTLIDAQAKLAAASAKTPELQKAVQDAAMPSLATVAMYMTQSGGEELLKKKIASDVWNAKSNLGINLDDIKHYGGIVDTEKAKQTVVQDAAATAQSRFANNGNRIAELSHSITNAQAARRGEAAGARDAMVGQFTAEGLSANFVGAGHAASALASGSRAVPADAADYNKLMAALHLTKKQQGEITKLLIEIFKDGIVKPEEMQQLKRVMMNMNHRP